MWNMENREMDKDGCNKEDLEENSLSIKKLEPQHLLVLGPHFTENCTQKLFFPSPLGLQNKLPKHIITVDERCFLRCLESIHIHSLRATTCNLSESLGSREVRSGNLAIECPQSAGTENYVADSTEEWILGAITGSKSMLNILNSPLLSQFGDSRGKENIHSSEEMVYSDLMSSPGGFSVSSSQKTQKLPEYHVYGSDSTHRRVLSISSTNSTCSEQSCLSTTAPISQGMLQRRWKNGLPHYVFSIDGKKDVYAADLLKIDSADDKFLDYVYTFYSRPDGNKEQHAFSTMGKNLVGKMTVSTSVTISSTKLEIMETRFVLFGSMDDYMDEIQTSHVLRKNKKLAKRVTDVFRTSQSYKQRSLSKFGGTSAILEDSSWVPSVDMYSDYYSYGNALIDEQIPPNFELAAIVTRDHIYGNSKEAAETTGGWGLKFLKKSGAESKNERCSRGTTGQCSTSMDVIVPAGFHGGPRSRHAGPSSLLDRWSSGGHCECGGWDVGCPLTVLKTGPNTTQPLSQSDSSGDCQTFDLYTQSSKQSAPVMKMANIHDGLYYIHFHSSLSALQSFAIAAAVIHRHSPFLRPKLYRK